MENVGDSMRSKITAAIVVKKLIVRENNGGDSCSGSFTVVVVSDEFEGVGPLDRQRRVNDVIKDEIKRLHAYVTFERGGGGIGRCCGFFSSFFLLCVFFSFFAYFSLTRTQQHTHNNTQTTLQYNIKDLDRKAMGSSKSQLSRRRG